MKRFLLPFLLLLFVGVAESSAINTGYYRVKSYNDKYLTENISNHTLVCSDLRDGNYTQVWYLTVNGSDVTFQNALTERYIQKTTGNSWSEQYVTGKSSNGFTLAELTGNDSGKFTFADKWEGGLHCDAGSNVVLWYTSDNKTKWTLETVTVNADALAAARAEYNLDLTTGYYRIKSNCYDNRYITENTSEQKLVTSGRGDSFSQIWYVQVDADEHTATIKNVLTDDYIQTQGTQSAQYSAGATAKAFVVAETKGSPNTYSFTDTGGRGLHCAATQSYNVVSWNSSADASIWQLEAVEKPTVEAIETERSALAEASASQLTTFFTTTACTELRSTYQAYSDEALRSAMSELPTTVQNMAIKVKNNSWTTYGGWVKTEKTFRIADYKAYSNGDRWTSILGCKHHLGRLSNPTGIWVNTGDIIHVYVGDVPDGQAVALEVAGYGQASGSTYSLHEGMNSLLMASSGNCFVFYEVDNTTDGGTPYKLMSNYADVTVHIEGGTVQGYFDLTKGDDDDDWSQMKTHLLTDAENRPTVCLKSDKHVMNLGITRLTSSLDGSSLTAMLQVWRNLSQWEDELMGRSDSYGGQNRYGQFCNNIFSVTALPGSDGSPHASTYGTFYYEYSDPKIFNADALLTVSDNLWCIAHEQGHNRQNPINMVGNTEISNNAFSNLAIYYQGRYTSRSANIQVVFNDYLDGISWPERVKRANSEDEATKGAYNQQLIHLNWSLYMFFHLNGKDPDFFPRLFDALREDPMTSTAGGDKLTPASTDYLKFYVKCCQVSGYDLTDFFASYGFFMLPPEQASSITFGGVTTNRYQTIGDYSTYNLYVTQEMIDQAKLAVSALNQPKANITFIEDRVKAPDAIYDGAPSGTKRTINSDAPVKAFGDVGEMGQYTDFGAPCSAYTFNISSRGNVTVSGTGAVGIIVYDNSGNIVGFYNTKTFSLPASAFDENGLKSGYSIKAAAGDGTMATATYDASIEVNEFPKVGVWYSFRTPLRGNRYMLSNGVGEGVVGTETTMLSNAMQWQFVLRDGEDETFDIKNRKDNSYLDPSAVNNEQILTSSSKPTKGWKISPSATAGMYIIYSGNVQLNQTNHEGSKGYKIYNWGNGSNTTDDGCQFTIEEVNVFPKEGVWYSFCSSLRGNCYMLSNGAGEGVVGTEAAWPSNSMQWQFVRRNGEVEAYDIVNRDNSYLSPVSEYDKQILTSSAQPSAGWKIDPAATDGMYIVYSGSVQLNQTDKAGTNGNKVFNWGGGSNTTDTGCQFTIEEVQEPSSVPLDELKGLGIIVSTSAANDLTTGQWYVMFNRGRNGYLYEKTTHTLDNTSTVPSDACPYLVRLIEASNGKYYLQTGYGNYFWRFQHGTRVSTTPQKSEPVTIVKIGGTDGHIYLQNVNSNIVLDSNNPGEGVVGYGTTVPSSTEGNNDWAFYPVTFTCPVNLNAYGYATFAGNYAADYTDDSSFSAWMVESVSGEEIVFQQIKEVAAPGTGVLLMGQPSTSVSVPLTNQNDGTDFSNENLLVGITTPTAITAGTYYGLSGNNFVKVNAGKVPARKALLPASVVDGAHVKALTFVFNSEDGIETMSNGQWAMDNVQIYNLAGQRLSKPQRGINIINGKKVLVK